MVTGPSESGGRSRVALPSRSRRFGVGKEIGGAVYVHRDYEAVLGDAVALARRRIPHGFDYTVVKLNVRSGTTTFVRSPDFDTADEPTIGDHYIVPPSGRPRLSHQARDPYIYHHKWLMVDDNYAGFDVRASKERSLAWLTLPGLDKSRIGRRGYWLARVTPLLQPLAT